MAPITQPQDETIRLDALPARPFVLHYALSRGERIRRYGTDEGVPLQVGDVILLDNYQRQLKVTRLIDRNTVTARPHPNADEVRAANEERRRWDRDH